MSRKEKISIAALLIFNIVLIILVFTKDISKNEYVSRILYEKLYENYNKTVQFISPEFELKQVEICNSVEVCSLDSKISKSKIVLWFPRNYCDKCLVEEIDYFSSFFAELKEHCLILITAGNVDFIKQFNNMSCEVYVVDKQRPFNKHFNVDHPVIYVFSKDKIITNVFIQD